MYTAGFLGLAMGAFVVDALKVFLPKVSKVNFFSLACAFLVCALVTSLKS